MGAECQDVDSRDPSKDIGERLSRDPEGLKKTMEEKGVGGTKGEKEGKSGEKEGRKGEKEGAKGGADKEKKGGDEEMSRASKEMGGQAGQALKDRMKENMQKVGGNKGGKDGAQWWSS